MVRAGSACPEVLPTPTDWPDWSRKLHRWDSPVADPPSGEYRAVVKDPEWAMQGQPSKEKRQSRPGGGQHLRSKAPSLHGRLAPVSPCRCWEKRLGRERNLLPGNRWERLYQWRLSITDCSLVAALLGRSSGTYSRESARHRTSTDGRERPASSSGGGGGCGPRCGHFRRPLPAP